MEQKVAGKLIFFRDGKELECPLTYNQECIMKSKIKQSLLSKEEAKFLRKKQGEEYDEKAYYELTSKGFSMVRIMPFIKGNDIVPNEYLLTTSLANNLSQEDAENIKRAVETIQKEQQGNILEEQIYTYDKKKNGKDTYYFCQRVNNQANQSESNNQALDSLLRYKLGNQTPEDKEMFKQYLDFNLEELLADEEKGYPITNRGEGVIIITPNGKRYSETKKKEQHKNEAQEMISHIFKCKVDDLEIEELAKKYGIIIIRIYKVDRPAIIAYCPEDMQVNQLDEFMKCLREIEKVDQKLIKKGKPKILALLGGNQDIEMDYEKDPDLESIAQKVEEYENRLINASISKKVAHRLNLITSDIGALIKHFGKMKSTLEEPEGR